MGNIIFTNKALTKMKDLGLSESYVLDTFNSGTIEKWSVGRGNNSIKKYNGYEIGVAWIRDEEGSYVITSVWKRVNRR
jgi:hypothetical protein